jgi:hypothetical protein
MPIFDRFTTNAPAAATRPDIAPPALAASYLNVGGSARSEVASVQREIKERALLIQYREKLPAERAPTVIADLADPKARVVVVGENHLSHHTRDLLSVNLPALKERGFTTLAVEFPTDLKELFSQFSRGDVPFERIKETITQSQETFGPQTTSAFISLIEKAHSLGMKIIPIDPGNNALKVGSREAAERERLLSGDATQDEAAAYFCKRIIERSQRMGEEVRKELQAYPHEKIITLVGAAHLSMDGFKVLAPPRYAPVSVPLLNNGMDSTLRSHEIPTSTVVVAQRVNLPPKYSGYSEPTMVSKVLSVSNGEPNIIHTKKAGIGGADAFVTLPRQ